MTQPPTESLMITKPAFRAFRAFLETLAGDAIGCYQMIERTIRIADVSQREAAVLLAVGNVTSDAYLAEKLPPDLVQLQAIITAARALADAALAYDRAIAHIGRQIDAEPGSAGTFVDSDHLDALYCDWLEKAHALKDLIGETP